MEVKEYKNTQKTVHLCTIFCASVGHTPNFYRVESINGLDFHTAFCRLAGPGPCG